MAVAYIFDLDGTLIDTEVLWVAATEDFLRDQGVTVTREWALDVVYGRSWHDVYAILCERVPEVSHMSLPDMQDAIDPYFHRLRDSGDVRIPGAVELLRRLAAEAPVCIVSGSSRRDVDHAVHALGIADAIAFSLSSDDFSPGKPDPTCYRMAARRLGVAPSDCLVFEDSAAGIRAAKAAGMQCVALAREGAPEQDTQGADAVVASLADFDPSRSGRTEL